MISYTDTLRSFERSEKGVHVQALVTVVLIGMFLFFLIGVVYFYGNLQSCDIKFTNYEEYKLTFCSNLILQRGYEPYWIFDIPNRCFRDGYNVKGRIDQAKVVQFCANWEEVLDTKLNATCDTLQPTYEQCQYLQ